jgi:hypothetical protein
MVPETNYPAGWWVAMARYVDTLPNVMGLAAFCDQDYGGFWTSTSLTGGTGRLAEWDADHSYLLENGWRV